MPGSFGGGDSGPWDSVIHHDHDKLDDHCEKIPVPLIHEVIIPRPVTSMADFVFTSVSRAPDGKFNNHKFHVRQCQAQIEILPSPDFQLTFT